MDYELTNIKLKYLEPILIDYLPEVLNFASYKKNENVRIQACITAKSIIDIVNIYATDKVQEYLFEGITNTNWQTKILALELLGHFSDRSIKPFSKTLHNVMPIVSNCIWDTKKEVKKIAKETTLKSMKTCDNNDIKNIIPVILDNENQKMLRNIINFYTIVDVQHYH